jgi:hypothetical protein
MAYVRAKPRGQRVYYYLVESKREGKKVRQRIIRYLGTKPPMGEELQDILKEVNDEKSTSIRQQKKKRERSNG